MDSFPGDLQSKIDPYLRPLYDALYQIMGAESFIKNSEKGLIEVAPLAYMRGRTLDNAFIILDEAQNTTPAQMKMFLTRIGFGSKVVITGDATQKTLPSGQVSGLDVAAKVIKRYRRYQYLSPYQQGRCTSSTGTKNRKSIRRLRKQTKPSR